MELNPTEWVKSETYLSAFESLIGDERTGRTFQGLIQGIIAGESLRAAVIARFSPRNGHYSPRGTEGQADGRRGQHEAQPVGC